MLSPFILAHSPSCHSTGEPDGPPNKVGVAVTDISTGLYMHGAILAALLSRAQTGLGVHIDCNLFETQLAGLANVASAWLVAGYEGARYGTSHPSIVPYQVFPCGGGGFLMLGAGNDKQFEKLARNVLRMPELVVDERFRTNSLRVQHRQELVQIITDALMKQDREHWLKAFTGQGCVSILVSIVSATHSFSRFACQGYPLDLSTTSNNHSRILKLLPAVSPWR